MTEYMTVLELQASMYRQGHVMRLDDLMPWLRGMVRDGLAVTDGGSGVTCGYALSPAYRRDLFWYVNTTDVEEDAA